MDARHARCPADPSAPEQWLERPAWPGPEPASLTEPAAIRRYDWAAFTALDRLGDTRRAASADPGWAAYHWVLTFHGEHALGELARRIQQELAGSPAGPALDFVDPERLNLPLVRVGGPEDVSGERLSAIEWAGRSFCLTGETLRLALGPVTGAPGDVRLSVTPWDRLTELHHGLRLATREVTGLRPWLRELTPYRPHVTVAYCREDLPAADLRPALERLRALPPVRLRVRRACLVRVAPVAGGTAWHRLASVPIGARISL